MNGIDRSVRAVLAVVLLIMALLVVIPLWTPLVVAAWAAVILRPVADRVSRVARGRPAVGAMACVVMVFALFVPVLGLGVSLLRSGVAYVTELQKSPEAGRALELIATGSDEPGAQKFVEVLQTHGATAWRLAQNFAGAGAWALIVIMTFSVALFQFLVEGQAMWRWCIHHSPFSLDVANRFGNVFVETGRGLLVGAGLTALAQGVVATITYVALGVPRAAVLGALTLVCAFVPAVGTAVVWIPIAIGLSLSGQTGKAAILTAVGLIGIGSIDNVLRPFLQRWGGHLALPSWLLLVAAFGGLEAFGPPGLLLGPLVLRLSKEVLEIAKEARDASDAQGA